ncbi:MAG: hypothetical protein ACFFEA_09065 [Candidatus Thorarchaeota archaeon]
MSHREKRDKNAKRVPTISLDEFKFTPANLDLRFSKNLLTVLDGYRIHRTYDLGFIDKKIGEGDLPRSFVQQWGTMRKVLTKLAAIGPKVPGVESSLNRRQTMSFIGMASLTIAVPILLLTYVFQLSWLAPIGLPLALIAVGMMLVSWLSSAWYNRKVAWLIHDYVEANQALVSNERRHLKKWVQILIQHFSSLLRKSGEDPGKNLVKFFNKDYTGIEVMKEPGGLRKHYVVKIRL